MHEWRALPYSVDVSLVLHTQLEFLLLLNIPLTRTGFVVHALYAGVMPLLTQMPKSALCG